MAEFLAFCRSRMRTAYAALMYVPRTLFCRGCYFLNVRRIRAKRQRGGRIRVVFLVDSLAKWKAQSLFDAMAAVNKYDPIIGVVRPHDYVMGASVDKVREKFYEMREFFKSRNMPFVELYDEKTCVSLDLGRSSPDIVFYPQSWYAVKGHRPYEVAHRVLTCYIPYSVPNYCDVEIYTRVGLLPFLWCHFALNGMWAKLFADANRWRLYAGRFVGVGHTMLDGVRFCERADPANRPCVIYAPHWTVRCEGLKDSLRYSTFAENGRLILEYAKKHQGVEWVFKPHPGLRLALSRYGVMSECEVDAYYNEWGKLGRCYDSAGYEQLFEKSAAMITDCGSFLTEYAVTGKPIIHLVSSESKLQPHQPLGNLFSTYYVAHSIPEMYEQFRLVIEDGKDPNRENRIKEIYAAKLIGNNAAKNIIDYFDTMFDGAVDKRKG